MPIKNWELGIVVYNLFSHSLGGKGGRVGIVSKFEMGWSSEWALGMARATQRNPVSENRDGGVDAICKQDEWPYPQGLGEPVYPFARPPFEDV